MVLMALPPGQNVVDGFPRFGTHLARPAPVVSGDAVIEVSGAIGTPVTLRVADLANLKRRVATADLHCVTGWSATGLVWEGVPFATLYREVIEPSVRADDVITHVVFGGLDGYRSVVTIDDATAEDVLIADRLDGRPLDSDHGAPARLVSPSQYGFVSCKHLCRIELHTTEPNENFGTSSKQVRLAFRLPLFRRHPRARVWKEERHRYLPAWSLRPLYRSLIGPIRLLSERGSRNGPTK